jgi:hypothetical protein
VVEQGILGVDQRQVRARGSQPRRQGDSADEDGLDSCEGCEAAIRDQKPTDTKTDVKTLGSKGAGMSLTDSVSVTSVASFLVKVASKDSSSKAQWLWPVDTAEEVVDFVDIALPCRKTS